MGELAGKKSLAVSMLVLLFTAGVYLLLFRCQFGPYVPAEYWLREVAIVKQQLCRETPSPKVLILSGSNALFGFDSDRLAHFLERPVINFGLHAGLSLEYLLNRYDLSLKPGDWVILPLEYELYRTAESNTSWFTTQVMAWDPAYFEDLSLIEKARFIRSVSPLRLFSNLLNRFLVRERRELLSEQEIMDSVRAVWTTGDYSKDYHFKNLNHRGDMARNHPIRPRLSPDYPVFGEEFEISPYTREQLIRFFSKCHREGVTVFVTWPCIIDDGPLDPEKARRFQDNILKIEAFMAEQQVPLLGDPMDFRLPESLFYDTKYHLAKTGRELRTLRLAKQVVAKGGFVADSEPAAIGGRLREMDDAATDIENRIEEIDRIRRLYWNQGKTAEVIQRLEEGLADGVVTSWTVPILLDYLTRTWTPSLHARMTETLASPLAEIEEYRQAEGAYLMATSPDGWTMDGMPGYLLLKKAALKDPDRKIRLVCNAAPQTYPLRVTFQNGAETVCYTFTHPGEIEITPAHEFSGDAHLFMVKTDKTWIPDGSDERRLGVQIHID